MFNSPMLKRQIQHCIHPDIKKPNELDNEGWERMSVVFAQAGKVQKLYFKCNQFIIFI